MKEINDLKELEGKTIRATVHTGHTEFKLDDYEEDESLKKCGICKNELHIFCTDGSEYLIVGVYGGWTGDMSICDEYPQYLKFYKRDEG